MTGRRVALIVATYRHDDPTLRQLVAPSADAEALAGVLSDPDVAGFKVKVLINEPTHVVGEAIGDFYDSCGRDDLSSLYFSGHGLKDDDGRLFLATKNTRRDRLRFTALGAELISDAMDACLSRRKILVLDCCYSGAFPAGRVSKADPAVHTIERFQGKGRAVLTASDSTQYSFEGAKISGQATQSVFTHFLVEALSTGAADLDGNGNISLDELYRYVRERVIQAMPQQRPKKQEDVDGTIFVAWNRNWILPPHLESGITSPLSVQRLRALDGLEHLYRVGSELVRSRVREQIERLVEDDSKKVSAAASLVLQGLDAIRQTTEAETAEREAADRAQREAADRAQREAADRAQREAADRAQRESARTAYLGSRAAPRRAKREAAGHSIPARTQTRRATAVIRGGIAVITLPTKSGSSCP
jgi:hypothetical protein